MCTSSVSYLTGIFKNFTYLLLFIIFRFIILILIFFLFFTLQGSFPTVVPGQVLYWEVELILILLYRCSQILAHPLFDCFNFVNDFFHFFSFLFKHFRSCIQT